MTPENFSDLHINMRVQLHLDYMAEHGDAHESFEDDLNQFCESDVTSVEEARLHISIAKLAILVSPTKEEYADIKDLLTVCLWKAETFLLFCDQKAGRA